VPVAREFNAQRVRFNLAELNAIDWTVVSHRAKRIAWRSPYQPQRPFSKHNPAGLGDVFGGDFGLDLDGEDGYFPPR
jgi:hypothetical protein